MRLYTTLRPYVGKISSGGKRYGRRKGSQDQAPAGGASGLRGERCL